MKLLFDRLLVETIPEEIKSSIIIPLTVKKKENRSKVVEAADNLQHLVGEIVLHTAGLPVEIEGKEYLILKQSEILAIV
jgi:co-chaperonin GroES (HSP10)